MVPERASPALGAACSGFGQDGLLTIHVDVIRDQPLIVKALQFPEFVFLGSRRGVRGRRDRDGPAGGR